MPSSLYVVQQAGLVNQSIQRREPLMLRPYVIRSKVGIPSYHLQRRVSQYLLQSEDITAVCQKLGGESMPA